MREVYGLERDADFRLAEYPTLSSLADYVISRMGNTPAVKSAPVQEPVAAATQPAAPARTSAPAPSAPTTGADKDAIYATIVAILCERTGYEADEIEPDFELEADLGVDTVKQAEIMAQVREVYGLERDADFRLAEHPTLSSLADYVISRMGQGPTTEPTPSTKPPCLPRLQSLERLKK